MNVTDDMIVITNVTDGGNVTRRLLRHDQRRLNSPELFIDYKVLAIIQSLGFQDATEATSFLVTALSDTISSGNFATTLAEKSESLGIRVFVNVTTNAAVVTQVIVSYNSATPTSAPSSAPSISFAPTSTPTLSPTTTNMNNGSSGGSSEGNSAVTIIIVFSVVFCCMLIALGILWLYRFKQGQTVKVYVSPANNEQ
jgi:hypothetical protein